MTMRSLRSCLGLLTPVIFVFAVPGHPLAQPFDPLIEIDGNAVDDVPGGPTVDWDVVLGWSDGQRVSPGGAGVWVFATDPTGTTVFTGPKSKDTESLADWRWTDGSVPAGQELGHAFAAGYEDPFGDLWLYFGADRISNASDWSLGIWVLQDAVGLNPDGTFSGVRNVGDLLIRVDFLVGRSAPILALYRVDGTGVLQQLSVPGYDMDSAWNLNTEIAPWPFNPETPVGCQSSYCFPSQTFMEGFLNLAAVVGENIGSVLVETRSSTTLSASLRDFVLLSFQPERNPALDDGVTCAGVRNNAQFAVFDGAGIKNPPACGIAPSVGYDLSGAALWLRPSATDTSLYVCVDLFGFPGDSDGDGGYNSTAPASECGGVGGTCGIVENDGPATVFGTGETVELAFDRTGQGTDLRFVLGFDELEVVGNDLPYGPSPGTILGGRGAEWQAEPLFAVRDSLSLADCRDPSRRTGAVILKIPDWPRYFPGRRLSTFNFQVTATGEDGEKQNQDVVPGSFNIAGSDSVQISVESGGREDFCGSNDFPQFTVAVTNRGTTFLNNLEVKSEIDAAFTYVDVVSDGGLGAPAVTSDSQTRLDWSATSLSPGESKSYTYQYETMDCEGPTTNRVTVAKDARLLGSVEATANCHQPGLDIRFVDACGVYPGSARFSVTNASSDTAAITLSGSFGSVSATVTGDPSPMLPPGGTRIVTLQPSSVIEPGTSVVVSLEALCQLSRVATPCMTEQTKQAPLLALEAPQVSVTSQDPGRFSPGESVGVPFVIRNESGGDVDLSFSGTFNGQPAALSLDGQEGVASDDSVTVEVQGSMPGVCEGDVPVRLSATAKSQDAPACELVLSASAWAQCSEVRFGLVTPNSTYKMMTFPVTPGDGSLLQALRNALGSQQNRNKWRLLQWSGRAYREVDAVELGALASVDVGGGYWLITADGRSEPITGSPTPLDTTYTLTLAHPDSAIWFQVGLPFLEPVPVAGIRVRGAVGDPEPIARSSLVEPTFKRWVPVKGNEGSPMSVDSLGTLEPGTGYWLKKIASGPVDLIIPPPNPPGAGSPAAARLQTASAKTNTRPGESEWAVRVQGVGGDQETEPLWMGAAPVASRSWNPMDLSLAPSPPGGYALVLFIPKTGWGRLSGTYVREFQPDADTLAWEFVLSASAAIPLRLDIAALDVPANRSIYLQALDTGRTETVGREGSVALPARKGIQRFRLVVGTGGIPEEYASGARIGTLQAFPNPFVSGTELRLEVFETSTVQVSIFDAGGRLVRRVYNGLTSAGTLRVPWDGRDAAGRPVAGGVFFVEYRVNGAKRANRLVKLD